MAREHAREVAGSDRARLESHAGLERAGAILDGAHVHAEPISGRGEAPLVLLVHAHERRDVECLVQGELEPVSVAGRLAPVEHVAVALVPGRVAHLRDDVLERLTILAVAVEEAHRIHAVAEVAKVSEQPHGTGGTSPGARLDEIAHAAAERASRIAEVIGAPEPCERRAPRGPEQPPVEEPGQLVEVETGHEDAIAERVRTRRPTPVVDPSRVDRALHPRLPVRTCLKRPSRGRRRRPR